MFPFGIPYPSLPVPSTFDLETALPEPWGLPSPLLGDASGFEGWKSKGGEQRLPSPDRTQPIHKDKMSS